MPTTVILGAGIIGLSAAHALADLAPAEHRIHLVELAPRLFASASGNAAGFLAKDWFAPAVAPLGALSFDLHRALADKHGGAARWGYARSVSYSLDHAHESQSEYDDSGRANAGAHSAPAPAPEQDASPSSAKGTDDAGLPTAAPVPAASGAVSATDAAAPDRGTPPPAIAPGSAPSAADDPPPPAGPAETPTRSADGQAPADGQSPNDGLDWLLAGTSRRTSLDDAVSSSSLSSNGDASSSSERARPPPAVVPAWLRAHPAALEALSDEQSTAQV